jgi:phospholipase/carboxylesterase
MKKRRWLVLLLVLALGPVLASSQPWRAKLPIIYAGGKGPPDLMLLHGFGSSAEHWVPYTKTLPFPPEGRFLFPEGPEIVKRSDGWVEGKAWWMLDLASYMRRGKAGVDLTNADPGGLVHAAKLVRQTLVHEGNGKAHPFILGGFSQGAIVACEVAFASSTPLAALIVLSGTPMDRAGWRRHMAARKDLPVFMSHGRRDQVLSFDLAARLRDEMVAAGIKVTFVPFDGGHEIPSEVVVALGKFLDSVRR